MLPYPFLDEYRAVRARLSKSDSFRASARMIGQGRFDLAGVALVHKASESHPKTVHA